MTSKIKIMIVEDEIITAESEKQSLEELGYSVISAVASAEKAIKKAEEDKPDLVLMDIELKGEMDGVEAAGIISSRFHIPTIFVTAYADDKILERAKITEPFGYIIKPFEKRELHSNIEMALYKKKAEKELKRYASEMEQLAEERSKQLIHADRMVTLGTLSAGIAHEIKNPVGFVTSNLQIFENLWNQPIRAYLEKANRENDDKKLNFALDEIPKMVMSMKEGTTRIRNIVCNLGKFSRKTKLAFEPSNIYEVIKAAVNFCRLDLTMKHKVKIHLDLPSDIPKIKMSRQEIEQVLINLLTNSGHAMKNITDRKELILKIAASHVSNNIFIEITDNGHGMDEKTLNNIFEPFFTTKDVGKGTGLGLSICNSIIERHRGAITVSSTLGEGTSFTIKLPVDPEMEERREKNVKITTGGMRAEDR